MEECPGRSSDVFDEKGISTKHGQKARELSGETTVSSFFSWKPFARMRTEKAVVNKIELNLPRLSSHFAHDFSTGALALLRQQQ
jgi:hypothetical protein